MNDNESAKQLFKSRMSLINKFPETRQGVLLDADAAKMGIKDKLEMLNT